MDGDRTSETFFMFGFPSEFPEKEKEVQSMFLRIYSLERSLIMAISLEHQQSFCKWALVSSAAPLLLCTLYFWSWHPHSCPFSFSFSPSKQFSSPFQIIFEAISLILMSYRSELYSDFTLPVSSWPGQLGSQPKQPRINYRTVQKRRSLVLGLLLISQNILTAYSTRAWSCQQTTCRPPISSMDVLQAGSWGQPAPLRNV